MQPIHAADAKTMWVNMRMFAPEQLANVAIPDDAKQYLAQVGLPEKVELLFNVGTLEPLEIEGLGSAVVIGTSWDDIYRVAVASTGNVYLVNNDTGNTAFANTTLPLYLTFLYWATNLLRASQAVEVGGIDSNTYRQQLTATVGRLTSLDKNALGQYGWWTSALQDFQLGPAQ